MLTTLFSYRLYAADLTRSLDQTAAAPNVQRDSDYYLAHIGDVKSIDDFMADDRLFSYAMKAFGLSDMTYAKAFMRKALEEGVDASGALANRLADSRYQDFVSTFNFARYGETTTAFDRTQQGTVDNYVRQTLEENAGNQNEGVRLALYFERKADGIDSGLDILADSALLKVVQTVLRIPEEAGQQDIDKQAAYIEKKLDIEDLHDPDKLQEFLTRFAALWDVDNSSTTTVSSPALALFATPTEAGIGQSLLLSLQSLKLGGI